MTPVRGSRADEGERAREREGGRNRTEGEEERYERRTGTRVSGNGGKRESERERDGRRGEKKRRWQIGFDSATAVVVAQKEEERMTYATWEG